MSCNVIRIGVIRLIQCVESIQRKCSVLLFTEDMADGLLKVFEGKDVAKGVGKIAKGVPNALVNLKSLLKSI